MKIFLYILVVGNSFSIPVRVPVANWTSCLQLLDAAKYEAAGTDTVIMFCGGPDMEYRPHGNPENQWKKIPEAEEQP